MMQTVPSCTTIVLERLFYYTGCNFCVSFPQRLDTVSEYFSYGYKRFLQLLRKKSWRQISTLRSQDVDLGERLLKCKLNLHTMKFATDSIGRRAKIIKTRKCCIPLSLISFVCFCKSSLSLFLLFATYMCV